MSPTQRPRQRPTAVKEPKQRMRRQLQQPKVVDTLTVDEVREVKIRNDEADWISERHAAAQKDVEHFASLATIARNEKVKHIRDLVSGKGHNLDDAEYNLDLERGVIVQTAEIIDAPQVEPEAGAANGDSPKE